MDTAVRENNALATEMLQRFTERVGTYDRDNLFFWADMPGCHKLSDAGDRRSRRGLASDSIAPDHRLRVGVFGGDGFDVVVELEAGADFIGELLEFLDDPAPFGGGLMPDAPEQQREQREDGDLRGE